MKSKSMTQEDKELLIKDLCARLPYQVKVKLHDEVCTVLGYDDDFIMLTSDTPMGQQTNIVNCKPYLRPMSSMTEEEKKEFESLGWRVDELDNNTPWNHNSYNVFIGVDWLNNKMFDYRGLISMGLAIEAPEGMYD